MFRFFVYMPTFLSEGKVVWYCEPQTLAFAIQLISCNSLETGVLRIETRVMLTFAFDLLSSKW